MPGPGRKTDKAPAPDSAVSFSIGVSFYPDHGRNFPFSLKRLTKSCTMPNEDAKTDITYIRKMHQRHKIPVWGGNGDYNGAI